jgi:phenylacetate-coenzyme A ligase PaaK-like adenylate-forming protein
MITQLLARLKFARFCVLHRRSLAAQRRWQLRHLRTMLRHAYTNVPIWRELLDERGLRPEDIRSLEDLSRLPTTRKQTFIGRMIEEYIDGSKSVRSYWYVTSGTSGTPFRFLMKERSIIEKYVDFASFRFLWWRGIPLDRLADMNLTRIKIRGPSSEHRLFVPVEAYLKNPRDALAEMVRFKTEILSAYPSILIDIARNLRADPTMPRLNPRFILSFGEMLAPSVRRFVEETLVRYGRPRGHFPPIMRMRVARTAVMDQGPIYGIPFVSRTSYPPPRIRRRDGWIHESRVPVSDSQKIRYQHHRAHHTGSWISHGCS